MTDKEIEARCKTPSRGRKCEKTDCPENQQHTCWIGYLREEQIISETQNADLSDDEIVMALREAANDWVSNNDGTRISSFGLARLARRAAKLIESMQAEVSTAHTREDAAYAALEMAQRRERAAISELESLMSIVGLKNYETCAYCQLDDDEKCFAGNYRCKAKWRGPQEAGEGKPDV